MPITIIQYETRDDRSLNTLMNMNKMYCVNKGYEYIRFGPLQDMPPYWLKVNLVLMVLRGAADGDIVVWLDSDAVIVDHDTSISELFKDASSLNEGSKFFLAASDPKPWSSPFNAGVFFVKANGVSRKLMEDWMDMYRPDKWMRLGDGSWKCSGIYNGDDYEQGAFVKSIMKDYKHTIKIYDADKFNCVSPVYKDKRPNGGRVFSCHFAGDYKARIPDLIAGNNIVRHVDVGINNTVYFSKDNILLIVLGAVIASAAIYGLAQKEGLQSRSPVSMLIDSITKFVKEINP